MLYCLNKGVLENVKYAASRELRQMEDVLLVYSHTLYC